MKRVLCALLAVCLLLGLAACGSEPEAEKADAPAKTTQPTVSTEVEPAPAPAIKPLIDPNDDEVAILIIGNSHSIDAFWLLHYAFRDQFPDANLCFGILHYNGASIDEHVGFIQSNAPVIRYYKHENGKRNIKYDVTAESVLTDRPWDVIMMQPAKEDLSDPDLNKDGRYALMEAVDKYVKTPHEFVWHISWPSPNDEIFFSPQYIRQPPWGYKEKLTKLYGFDPVNQFTVMTEMTKKHVLSDPTYSNGLCSGASVMYAYLVEGMPQIELWRDYTHLSDFSRLMVAYTLTAQLTGKKLETIKYDEIKIGWRHKQNKPQGVQKLTKELKNIMIRSVNYALEHPWDIPEKPDTPPTYVGKSTAATTTATQAPPTTTTTSPSTTTTTQAPSTTGTTGPTDTTATTPPTTSEGPTSSSTDTGTSATESTTSSTESTVPTDTTPTTESTSTTESTTTTTESTTTPTSADTTVPPIPTVTLPPEQP